VAKICEVLSSGNDRDAAVDENGEAVDSADVRQTPVITGDLRISERLVQSTFTSPKVR
jgi:hypothetical protein